MQDIVKITISASCGGLFSRPPVHIPFIPSVLFKKTHFNASIVFKAAGLQNNTCNNNPFTILCSCLTAFSEFRYSKLRITFPYCS